MSTDTYKTFKADVATLTLSLMGAQHKAQLLTERAIKHCFDHRLERSWITHLLNSLENVGGSFRIESLIVYIEDFAGLTVKPDEDKGYGVIVTKNSEWKGTRGKVQFQKLRKVKWYEYKAVDPLLKAPVPSIDSLAVTTAKAINVGEMSIEEAVIMAGKLVDTIKAKQKDEKVVSWSVKYLEQQMAA